MAKTTKPAPARASHPGLQPKPAARPAARPAAQPTGASTARRASTSIPAEPRLAREDSTSERREPGFKVRVLKLGFIYDERKRPGDVFQLQYADEFTPSWMERVPDRTPTRTTSGQEQLRREHEQTLRERASGLNPGVDNPIGGPDPIGVDD